MKHTSPFICILAGAALVVALPLSTEARTFTSPDGRTVEAEIQSATTDTVTLLANGQALTVDVTKFSKADQAYIAEWRKANPVTINYNFTASYTKDKRDSSTRKEGSVEITTEVWTCNVKLANRSGQDLDRVKVDYEIYYSQMNGSQPVVRKVTGSTTLEGMKNLEETTLKTKEVKLSTSKLDGGRYYADGSRSRKKDSIEGVALKISHAGKPAFEWASSGVPKDRRTTATGTEGTLNR